MKPNAGRERLYYGALIKRLAIDNREMVLFYQSKIDAHSSRIVGAEALARWVSPLRGMVSLGIFVPALDDMGFGNKVGERVLE